MKLKLTRFPCKHMLPSQTPVVPQTLTISVFDVLLSDASVNNGTKSPSMATYVLEWNCYWIQTLDHHNDEYGLMSCLLYLPHNVRSNFTCLYNITRIVLPFAKYSLSFIRLEIIILFERRPVRFLRVLLLSYPNFFIGYLAIPFVIDSHYKHTGMTVSEY